MRLDGREGSGIRQCAVWTGNQGIEADGYRKAGKESWEEHKRLR